MFSPNSRRNLLKRIAQIDWSKLPEGLFVTLTYPDGNAAVDLKTATHQRHRWIQYAERYLSEEIPILWRKEQQIRKSGEHRGLYVPHIHMSVFTERRLPWQMVRDWWARCIGHEGHLATDVQRMSSGEHAAFYIAKYMTVTKDSPSLDYHAYLTKPGRAWGIHRPKLLPWCKAEAFLDLDEETFEKALQMAQQARGREIDRARPGAVLMGDMAKELMAEIRKLLN